MNGIRRRQVVAAITAVAVGSACLWPALRLVEAAEQRRVLYFHPDHLGSVSLVTDEQGRVVARREYRPFGATAVQEVDSAVGAAAIPHSFTGQHYDASTALYDFHARCYDPQLGRFVQPDELVRAASDPQALNRYSYARNNPLVLTDPTGHFFWVPFFLAAAKVAAAISLASTVGSVIAAGTGHDRTAAVFSKIAGVSGVIGGFSGGFTAFNFLTASVSAASVGLSFSSNPQVQQASQILAWTGVGLQAGRGVYDYLFDNGSILTPAQRPGAFNDLIEQGGDLRVNGILNSPEQAQALASARNSIEFYNPSHGLIADLSEAALDKTVGLFMRSSIERQLDMLLGLAQKPVTIIAHSQGGIITANALLHLGKSLPPGSSVVFEGTQLSQPRALLSAWMAGIPRANVRFHMNVLDPSSLLGPTIDPLKLFGGVVGAALLPIGIRAHTETVEF